ncbi:MAG TPA: ZIP family metal transporter [Solirubrobacterales bacterium]|jgi:ZIP family zinc transporter
MASALGWGALATSSLVLGALLAFARQWPPRQIGLVLAFGAGALISAVSFELAAEGLRVGTLRATAIGLGVGALTYFGLDGLIADRFSAGRGQRGRAGSSNPGTALALGAFLDGIPEQLVLGIGLAGGGGIGVGLLVAIFVSNLPEAIGSASEMRKAGTSRRTVLRLWAAVAAICTLACVVGYVIADAASGELQAGIDGFAAGALLVMLIDSMIPEATRQSGRIAGLVTTLGFAVATALSSIS